MNYRRRYMVLFLGAVLICSSAQTASFYTEPDIFAFRPKENRKGQTIDRFGPVGIGIELTLPAFGMKIRNVEPGSPAAQTGTLKAGQIIESINGKGLDGRDPRIQLGEIITRAEATKGLVQLRVKDAAEAESRDVVVKIPVLGEYSASWPLTCAKSDRIVRDLADHLRQRETFKLGHDSGPAMLFMLSTGDARDLDVVRGWIAQLVEQYKDTKELTVHNWVVGYGGIPLCEYYLRTGDRAILPLIELLADKARWDMYNNAWAHGTYQGVRDRTKARMAFPYMGGGHMNVIGEHVTTFLLMAKACGAKVDEVTLQSALRYFSRFAGRGNVPYGDGIPEQSFVDNGKTGGLAFTMAAAAALTPDGEQSVYAQARDNSAVKGFYSSSWMFIGHTGGGIGEIWRSASMGLMADAKPKKYREFMDNRMWFYELSRRFDGSFGIVGGSRRYDKPESWGVMMGLTYTLPRKTLYLSGAPRSKFAKQVALPSRPWGTAADDAFYSVKPARQPNGSIGDVDKETFARDASRPAFAIMAKPDVSDDVLLAYAHHPDQGIRRGAANFIANQKRDHLVPVLLKSRDPRVRHAGTMVIHCNFKRRPIEASRVTDEMVTLLAGMINSDTESWWCIENALKAFSLARPELIAAQLDRVLYWLAHDEWWLSAAAMDALSRIAGHERYAAKVLPAVADVIASNTRVIRMQKAGSLFTGVRNGSPKVQAIAVDSLSKAYGRFPMPETLHGPDQIHMDYATDYLASLIAGYLAPFPGGLDALYPVSVKRYPEQVLPHSKLYQKQDVSRLSPDVQKAVAAFNDAKRK